MSASRERDALDPRISLLEHAQRLHRQYPDGPIPNGGLPFPDSGRQPRMGIQERKAALTAVLQEFLDKPASTAQDLHDRCTRIAVNAFDVPGILQKIAPDSPTRLFEAGRWLIANATDRRAVYVGLGILDGHAEPRDIPVLTVIGRLNYFDMHAMKILASIPDTAQHMMRLADRSSRTIGRITATEKLVENPDPSVRNWVRSIPLELLASDLARQIAEHHDLAALLDQRTVDDNLWDQAGNLLQAMNRTDLYRPQITQYAVAPIAYQRWIALAASRPATLDRAAALTMAALDLSTGPAAPAVADLRHTLTSQIAALLTTPPWTEALDRSKARRATWVRQALARINAPIGRFAVRILTADPNPARYPWVEARIMIDGMPVVPVTFDRGPVQGPEQLVYTGALRATNEPKEVRLAEAACAEGCCGALYVTIVRDGPEVVWKDWRRPAKGDPPPEVRFDAQEYDREVARAEQDHEWEWPARTIARLVTGRLQADPTIFGRWDCEFYWCTASLHEFDIARLTFLYPACRDTDDTLFAQFGMVIDAQDHDPQTLATEVIESMRTTDPKQTADMINGTEATARKLGRTKREPTRW